MDTGTGRGRGRGKKRVSAEELDHLLYLHAQSIFGDADDLDPAADEAEWVALGYPLALAFDLWTAWKDHHVMPRRGGYLDQPRRWQKLIHTLNRRFNRQYERAREEHQPPQDSGRRTEDEDVLSSLLGELPVVDGNRPPSWEQFKWSE